MEIETKGVHLTKFNLNTADKPEEKFININFVCDVKVCVEILSHVMCKCVDIFCVCVHIDGCLLDSTTQLCTKLASNLTYAVVQATDMFSQVKSTDL